MPHGAELGCSAGGYRLLMLAGHLHLVSFYTANLQELI